MHKKTYSTRNMGRLSTGLSNKRALPSSGYMKSQNGKVRVIKPADKPATIHNPYIPKHVRDIMKEE